MGIVPCTEIFKVHMLRWGAGVMIVVNFQVLVPRVVASSCRLAPASWTPLRTALFSDARPFPQPVEGQPRSTLLGVLI